MNSIVKSTQEMTRLEQLQSIISEELDLIPTKEDG